MSVKDEISQDEPHRIVFHNRHESVRPRTFPTWPVHQSSENEFAGCSLRMRRRRPGDLPQIHREIRVGLAIRFRNSHRGISSIVRIRVESEESKAE
jgi:hypothetical protein